MRLPVPFGLAAGLALTGVPRTFHVVPGCYAGDSLPVPSRLPAGCDASRVRAIPPRTAAIP